ncbi:MAG: hypothetical protein PUD92_07300 [Clostridiales bacterium]|nr:hypothetical protein [Clostridiales bacterium]
MKRAASMLIAASMLAAIAAPCAMADESYIYIDTAADIKDLADSCVIDSYSTGKTVVLGGDIDISGTDFTGIPYFNGTFDGGGHTISGVTIEVSNPERGFIGIIGENGTVSNLTVQGSITADAGSESSGTNENGKKRMLKIIEKFRDDEKTSVNRFFSDSNVYSVGGITGVNKGTIINCTYSGNVSATENVGGIAGLNKGRIETSANYSVVSGEKNTGGIAGKNTGIIKWCQNNEKVNDTPVEEMYATGGICGASEGVVDGCTNNASVGYKNAGTAAGGICGVQNGNITDCINTGTVSGKSRVGGIAGNFEPYTNITYNEDEWSEHIDEQKEKIRNDLDNIEGRIDENRDKIKGDLDDFDNRFKNLFGINELNDNIGTVTDSIAELNGVLSDRIKNGDSLSGIADSIADAVDVLDRAEGNLSSNNDALRDVLTETRNTAKTMSDVAQSVSDDVSSGNDHLISLVDSINESIDDQTRRDNINKTIDSLNDAIDSTSKAMDNLAALDLDNIKVNLSGLGIDIFDDTDTQLSKILRKMNENYDNIFGPIISINNALKEISDNLAQRKAKLEELKKQLEDMLKDKIPSPSPSEGYLPVEKQTAKSNIFSGLFITARAAEDDAKTTLEKLADLDIHDIDIPLRRTICGEEYEMALIKYSINSGTVSGLNDIGGISGGVGFEYGINNEKKVTTDGRDFSFNPSTAIKSVIEACINEGGVTAKNNTAGGITGFSDIGKIKDSINYGNIAVTDGSYAGGISGYNMNEIMRCINIGDADAKSDIGGIAGYGKHISQTYSLTRTTSDGDRIGAVAGTAGGNLEHNYFLEEKLGGINGVNYNDKAQPVKKDIIARDGEIAPELAGLEELYWTGMAGELYMPQLRAFTENTSVSRCEMLKAKSAAAARFRFTVTFTVDSQAVKTFNLDYGETIPADEVPEIPKKNGKYGVWDRNVKDPIIRNTKFTAVYDKSTSTLSYGGEPPQILAEGDFSPAAVMEVNEFNPAAVVSDKKYKTIAGYELILTDNGSPYEGELRVHVRIPKNMKNPRIGLITESSVLIADSETDGSYLLFSPDGAQRFIVLSERPSPVPYIAAGIIILAFLALLFVFRKRIKERRLLNKIKLLRADLLQLSAGNEENTKEKKEEELP